MEGRILTNEKIEAFGTYLRNEEKSENTIQKYLRDARAFIVYQNGAVVTKEQLYQDIWENDYDTSPDATLKFHVKELRKKLSRSGAGNLIETAWGIGYILRSDSDISP